MREAFGRQSSQKSAPLRNRQDALDRVRCVTREDIKSPEYLSVVKKDTEVDLVQRPGEYWEQIKQNAEKATPNEGLNATNALYQMTLK